MIQKQEKRLFTKRRTLEFLEELDNELISRGYQKMLNLYCTGGIKMVLSGLRYSTEDLDFLISREDFRVLGLYVVELDRKYKIRFDLFSEGRMPGYTYPDFKDNAIRTRFKFRQFDLYYVDDVDLIMMKALAGRVKDREDLKILFSKRSYPKEKILERYQKVKFDIDKEKELKQKFQEFLKHFYQG